MPDALTMLREDHRKVQDLFKQFEDTESPQAQQAIVNEAITELLVHSTLEEELFYPRLKREGETEKVAEATEEHHVVDLLIAELTEMRPNNPQYKAKFTVLAENVKHHIQEEESEMLPKAAELGRDALMALGEDMQMRKQELMSQIQGGNGHRSSNGTRRKSATGARRTATRRTTTSRARNGRTTTSRATNGRTTRGRTGTARRTTGSTRSTTTRSRAGASTTGRKRTATTTGRTSTRRTSSRATTRPPSRAAASRGGRTTAARTATRRPRRS